MTPVERPDRPAAPPALGRLGVGLAWLAGTQGGWPPQPPRRIHHLDMTAGEGLRSGCDEADQLVDSGVDLLTLEASGDPVASLVVICALLDLEPVLAVGTSTDPGWSARLVAVRDGLRAARSHVGDPEQLAADPVLGRSTGLLTQCAVRRTGVVLGDSVVLAAAALLAERMSPGARHWWMAGSAPSSTAAQLALADLALDPLLDLGLAVPGGGRLATDLLLRGVELAGA